ncbi:MAG: FAD binding domain-containing protein, partial [Actinomycetota bacterium]|nr:FAD binding domain-containing protein [Actinomycetota bacterium]
ALAHADPAGDLAAVAVALDATMVIAGQNGRRQVGAEEFFVDYLTTAMADNEVLTEIRVPKHTGWGSSYEKFSRVAQAWAMVGVAALVRRDDGPIAEARIGLTNMGPTPIRATAVEQALAGAENDDAVASAAAHAGAGAAPGSDLNAQADYRTHLATVLTKRAVLAAIQG